MTARKGWMKLKTSLGNRLWTICWRKHWTAIRENKHFPCIVCWASIKVFLRTERPETWKLILIIWVTEIGSDRILRCQPRNLGNWIKFSPTEFMWGHYFFFVQLTCLTECADDMASLWGKLWYSLFCWKAQHHLPPLPLISHAEEVTCTCRIFTGKENVWKLLSNSEKCSICQRTILHSMLFA